MAGPAANSYVDIGANLLDSVFRGKYHGKRAHDDDMNTMLDRAASVGVSHVMVTCSNLKDARRGLAWARAHNSFSTPPPVRLATTVGVHPTNTMQLEAPAPHTHPTAHGDTTTGSTGASVSAAPPIVSGADSSCGCGPLPGHDSDSGEEAVRSRRDGSHTSYHDYVAALHGLLADGVRDGTVVAIGECGLDYDRLFFSPKEVQLRHFELHFDLAEKYKLPMFFHDRNTGGDFASIVRRHRHRFPTGVVHSFTGTKEELDGYLEMGLYIGINGCSLKTAENLAVVRTVPLDRLMLETDAPWCEIKKAHASYPLVKTLFPSVRKEKYGALAGSGKLVNGRCEPCQIVQVAEVVAALLEVPLATVCQAARDNSMAVFFT